MHGHPGLVANVAASTGTLTRSSFVWKLRSCRYARCFDTNTDAVFFRVRERNMEYRNMQPFVSWFLGYDFFSVRNPTLRLFLNKASISRVRWFGWMLLFLASASFLRADTPNVSWFVGPFEQALQIAKQQKKQVFLDMYADWCHPCKRMEREVFPKPEVRTFLDKHFVSLKRDGMRAEGAFLAKRYNCVTYPCMLVIDEQGQEVGRLTRFTLPQPFVQQLTELRDGKNTLPALLTQLQQQPRDPVLHFRVGFRYAYRGDARCIQHLQFTAQNPPSQFPHLAAKALYTLGRIYYRNTLRDCASANRTFLDYIKRFPNGADIQRVRNLYNGCLRRLRR